MNYEESLEYLYTAKSRGARKNGLVNIRELLRRLGNPETRFPSVHVAGTNGKGSVCAFTESILRAAGHKTGLYTSPYLERFTERIRVGGAEIAPTALAETATEVREAAEAMAREGLTPPTFFELTTACCFLIFAREAVDIAVIETGLGGRTDATNVLRPAATAITAIGMDHAHALGGTIDSIAREKAGILRPGVPCVLSSQPEREAWEALTRAARETGAPLVDCGECAVTPLADGLNGQRFRLQSGTLRFDSLTIALLGPHQLANAATAVLLAVSLRGRGFPLSDGHIAEGLAAARWPGRMEVLRRAPLVLLDGAHNPQGARALADGLARYLGGQRACVVVGAMADKDAGHMAEAFSRFAARVIATEPPSHGRGQHSPGELAGLFAAAGVPAEASPDYVTALRAALSSGLPVVVCGSLYLAGAARTWLIENMAEE